MPKKNLFTKYAEAFNILSKYENQYICAEHDEIWIGPANTEDVSLEDVQALKKLGFKVADEGGFHKFV